MHHSRVEIPLEISIEARKRESSQKSSSGHHGSERRWDRGKHARYHYDLQVTSLEWMILVVYDSIFLVFFKKNRIGIYLFF